MQAETPRVYWDANVLLSYVNGIIDRLEEIESILDASRRGDLVIVTSVFSITEVAFGAEEQTQSILSPEIENEINQLWTPGSPVTLIEVHELIAAEARGLVRAGMAESRSLKPADAIHLASARHAAVADFHTYDEQLHRWSGLLGFPVRRPIAREPRLPGA